MSAWGKENCHISPSWALFEHLPAELLLQLPNDSRPQGRAKTLWMDYIPVLGWEHIEIPKEKLEDVTGKTNLWAALLNGLIDGWMGYS